MKVKTIFNDLIFSLIVLVNCPNTLVAQTASKGVDMWI